MNIGLIDLDGKFPNLALMKISAYHKQNGDNVDFATIGDYDKLYILNTDSIGVKEYGNGTALTYQYKTGYIAENGLTNYKAFKDVYIYSSGSVNLKTYIDGLKVNDLDLLNGLTNFKIAQEHHRGYYIEFELVGTGTVYEIDIVSEGRQNGR